MGLRLHAAGPPYIPTFSWDLRVPSLDKIKIDKMKLWTSKQLYFCFLPQLAANVLPEEIMDQHQQ